LPVSTSNARIPFPRLRDRFGAGLLALVLVFSASGCATARSASDVPREPQPLAADADYAEGSYDPWEGFNRAIFGFNDKFDRYLAKPVAKGYRSITPRPLRRSVSNFFNNLYEPVVMLNNALQGKFGAAASDLGRFVTNSTVGVLGIFDVASKWGMTPHDEDLGQTLGAWGVKEGPFLVLPFLGPSTLRDGVGLIGDYYVHPAAHIEDRSTASAVKTARIVDARYRLLEAGDILDQAAGDDPYVFVREAYLQRRRGLVTDGGSEGPAVVDPSIFEDDPPK
jgi:phospholipid-binding lipoprotein MlaA